MFPMPQEAIDTWKYIEDPKVSLEKKVKHLLGVRNCTCETISFILGLPKNRVSMELNRLSKWNDVQIVSLSKSRIWRLNE